MHQKWRETIFFKEKASHFLPTNTTMKIQGLCRVALLLPLGLVDSSPAAASALEAFQSLDYRFFVAGGTVRLRTDR